MQTVSSLCLLMSVNNEAVKRKKEQKVHKIKT